MKLYLVHCGYYDPEISKGIYEFHTNYFVVAADELSARKKTKEIPEVRSKKMHVDGIVEISSVDGYRIKLEEDVTLNQSSELHAINHHELATPKAPPTV